MQIYQPTVTGSLPWFSFFYGLNLFVDSLMLEYGAWMHSKMDCNECYTSLELQTLNCAVDFKYLKYLKILYEKTKNKKNQCYNIINPSSSCQQYTSNVYVRFFKGPLWVPFCTQPFPLYLVFLQVWQPNTNKPVNPELCY